MQYIPEKHNKYTNGIYYPPPNYNVKNPDFWSAGILSPEVNSRLAHGLANIGKKYEPQLRYVNAIMSQPIKPTKKYHPRDSIFANFGMIGSQPYTRDHEPERVQQEQQAGLEPVSARSRVLKTGGARKKATKKKIGKGKSKKRVVKRR